MLLTTHYLRLTTYVRSDDATDYLLLTTYVRGDDVKHFGDVPERGSGPPITRHALQRRQESFDGGALIRHAVPDDRK